MDGSDQVHIVTASQEEDPGGKVSEVMSVMSHVVENPPTPQVLAQGVRGEIPLMWDLLQESYSAWIMTEAARQKEVVRSLIPPPNLPKLTKLHSSRESGDPCNIEAFRFQHPELDATYVKDLENSVCREIDTDKKQADTQRSRIDKLIEKVKLLDVGAIEDRLVRTRDSELARLLQASQRVGEIFSRDPNERKSRQDVLLAECGPTRVEGMTEGQKNDVYKDIRSQRMVARLNSACSMAKVMSNLEEVQQRVLPSLDLKEQLSAQEVPLEYFKRRKAEAAVAQAEVDKVIRELEEAMQRGKDQLATAREKKSIVERSMNDRRTKLQHLLAQLHSLEDEYMNLHIEDEAHRISCDNLEQDLLTTAHRLEMAHIAAMSASEACQKWDSGATEHMQSLLNTIQSEVQGADDRMTGPVTTAGLNAYMSMELLKTCLSEKNTEIASIMLREEENTSKVKQLQAKLEVPEEDTDVVELEVEVARRSDETKANLKDIESCREIVREATASLAQARESYSFLAMHKAFGERVREKAYREDAQHLVGTAYIEHIVFPMAKPRFGFLPREDLEAELPEPGKGCGAFEWVDAPELKKTPIAPAATPQRTAAPADYAD